MALGMNLEGKVAFVAGVGDSSGYGWAICKALAEAGAKLDGEGLVSEAVVVPTPTAQTRKTRALSFTVPEVQPAGAVVAVAPAPATIFSSAESM